MATESKETKAKNKEKGKKSVGREILEWILTIVAAVAIAMPIRAFVFQLVRVEGDSMDDTLANGEIMFTTKFDYATTWLCFPWQDAETKQNAARITTGGNPERFDVVICRYPGRGDTNFVKRVVGLPGDTVELRNGDLYVNDVKYDEPYVEEKYRSGWLNNFGPYTVPEGKYFVMGDHRNNSNDSRSVGPIPRDMIMGHVRTVVFPFNKIRGIE